MTQREIERVSGWVALACWAVLPAIFVLLMLVGVPQGYRPFGITSDKPAAQHAGRQSRHTSVATAAAAEYTPVPQQSTLDVLMGAFWLMLPICIASSLAWRWRRRQRVRAEIRAEAWGRESLELRRRNRAASAGQVL